MNSRLSPALIEFSEGRWPDVDEDRRTFVPRLGDLRHMDLRDMEGRGMHRHDLEPPLHPSELDRYENERWTVRRRMAAALRRVARGARGSLGIAFCVGIAVTLGWQAYGNGARRMAANWSPRLAWLAPRDAPNGAGMSADQLAALSHSLATVRQSVDRLAADISRLQAAKPADTASLTRTSGPPPGPAAATTARKPPPAR